MRPEEMEELETREIVRTRVLLLLGCQSLTLSLILNFSEHRLHTRSTSLFTYASAYLCTEQSARTCRAHNISRVQIELPPFVLFSILLYLGEGLSTNRPAACKWL